MSTTSATPPATRRIAKSYLTDLIGAIPVPEGVDARVAHGTIGPVVEQLIERALNVRHVLRHNTLVLTFDLADDPAGWTSSPASPQGSSAGLDVKTPDCGCRHGDLPGHVCANLEYPGQPERTENDDLDQADRRQRRGTESGRADR